MRVKCPKCGWENPENAAACANCFQDLRSPQPAAPQQQPQQTQQMPGQQPPPQQPYQPHSPYGQQQQAPPQQRPYPQQPQYPQAAYYDYAGFWIRVGAALIDGILLGGVHYLINMATHTGGLTSTDPMRLLQAQAGGMLLDLAIGCVYFVGMNTVYGATLGKMALGLTIVKSDGSSITFGTALLRYIVKSLFAMITCGLAYIAVAVDERHQGWHDKIADTIVIHTR